MNKKIIILGTGVLVILIAGFYVTNINNSKKEAETFKFNLLSQNENIPVNKNTDISFSISDKNENVVKQFAITHEKIMHFIIVRKDLSTFSHLHPDFDPNTGIFTLKDFRFPSDGEYRLFGDFMVGTTSVTEFSDVKVGDLIKYQPLTLKTTTLENTFDGYYVTLTTTENILKTNENINLAFTIKKDGKAVTDLQKYLGALGHSVILKENTLDFLHVHPVEEFGVTQTGKVDFITSFSEVGKYKVFTQFERDNKIITTSFVVDITKGTNTTPSSMKMQHNMQQ